MNLKGSRTVLFNVAAVLLPVTDVSLQFMAEAEALVSPTVYIFYAIGINVANVWLRMITTTPVGYSQ